ncbi:helix-turn-helix domain-containing protein [Embleya hyalina]|uniref:helix-turn-helix domain-containing protein n=1 Tax=Embleya hyalina TaxID=516124 RepID=UPI003530880B
MHQVRQFLYQSDGIRLVPQQPSERHPTGGEREEISRGSAAGESARQPAKRLGRPPSTVSREIARNGGRNRGRLRPRAPAQAGQARPTTGAARPDGGQAVLALVSRSDRRMAATPVSW